MKITRRRRQSNFSLIDFLTQPLTKMNIFDNKQVRFIIKNNEVSLKYLTPFQGEITHRVYGYFRCSNCSNKWKC